MPYPTQITPETIVAKARELIEAEGIDQLSLGRLAAGLNVKAPSLYRYFNGKAELLRAVNAETSDILITSLSEAIRSAAPHERAQIEALAHTYRAFAHKYPVTYSRLFTNTTPELRPDVPETELSVLPLQAVMAALTGEADSLPALRGLLALVHGYVTLELNGQFRRGGDLDQTFARIVEAFINGWQLSND